MGSLNTLRSFIISSACALALVGTAGCAPAASPTTKSTTDDQATARAENAKTDTADTVSNTTAESTSETSPSSSSSTQSDTPAASDAGTLSKEDAISQGYQVFHGTIRVCTGEQLIKLQGIDIDPAAAGGNGTYAVLVFDEPTDVTGESGDGSGQRTDSSKMLGIAEHTEYGSFVVDYGDLEKCKGLDGQKADVAAKAQDIMFPSDVRLPIGQPSTKSATFI